MPTLTLPQPIARYFASEHDPDMLGQCFAANAVMQDEGRHYAGIDAIKAFMAAASAKYQATSVPFACTDENGVQVVRAQVSGNFPGSPVTLTYRFALERGLIASLEIVA